MPEELLDVAQSALSHSALGGATPAEAYFGWFAGARIATAPPRGRPGEANPPPPFRIGTLDPQGRYPILVKAA